MPSRTTLRLLHPCSDGQKKNRFLLLETTRFPATFDLAKHAWSRASVGGIWTEPDQEILIPKSARVGRPLLRCCGCRDWSRPHGWSWFPADQLINHRWSFRWASQHFLFMLAPICVIINESPGSVWPCEHVSFHISASTPSAFLSILISIELISTNIDRNQLCQVATENWKWPTELQVAWSMYSDTCRRLKSINIDYSWSF